MVQCGLLVFSADSMDEFRQREMELSGGSGRIGLYLDVAGNHRGMELSREKQREVKARSTSTVFIGVVALEIDISLL